MHDLYFAIMQLLYVACTYNAKHFGMFADNLVSISV